MGSYYATLIGSSITAIAETYFCVNEMARQSVSSLGSIILIFMSIIQSYMTFMPHIFFSFPLPSAYFTIEMFGNNWRHDYFDHHILTLLCLGSGPGRGSHSFSETDLGGIDPGSRISDLWTMKGNPKYKNL